MYLIVAAFLGFLAVSGFFGRHNLRGIEIDIVVPDEIFAGMESPWRITVNNKRRFFPAFLIRVMIGGETWLFPYIDAGKSASRLITFSFDRRGPQNLENIYLASIFPFNFFTRYRKIRKIFNFTVFPVPLKMPVGLFPQSRNIMRGEIPANDQRGSSSEVFAMRDYVAGDALKHIHWKASARTGNLKTKEYTSFSVKPVLLVFEELQINNLEHKVSYLTYMILDHVKKSIPVGLKVRGRVYPPSTSRNHKLQMLRELALIGHEETSPSS